MEAIMFKPADYQHLLKELAEIKERITNMGNTHATSKLLTVDEVCQRLSCGRNFFEQMRRDVKLPLPAFKMSGKVYVRENTLNEWIDKYEQSKQM